MKRLSSLFALGLGAAMVGGCASSPKPAEKLASAIASPTTKSIKITRQVEVRDVAFSPNNSPFVVAKRVDVNGKYSGKIEVWDARARRRILTWNISQAPRAIDFLDANRLAISGSNSLQIWDVRIAKLLKTVTGPGAAFTVSPKRNLVATEREIWRVTDWKKLVTIRRSEISAVRAAAISPDETILVTAAWDDARGLQGFGVKTGRSLWRAEGDQEGNVAFSPDGRSVGVSTIGGIVLLNPKTGRVIRRIGHSYGGEFRFLSNQNLVQKNVNGSRNHQESRITYAVSTGKTLTTTPTLENEVITLNGLPRIGFVGAEKAVIFK